MRGYRAASFYLSERTEKILKRLSKSYTQRASIVTRAKIVLMAADEKTNTEIAEKVGTTYATVSKWRNRFYDNIDTIAETEQYDEEDKDIVLSDIIISILSDEKRPGKPAVFTPEQIMLINELACKNPKEFGYELSHWNITSIAKEAVNQGIVESISACSVQRFLKYAGIEPWKNRYWLNSPEKHEAPEEFKKN